MQEHKGKGHDFGVNFVFTTTDCIFFDSAFYANLHFCVFMLQRSMAICCRVLLSALLKYLRLLVVCVRTCSAVLTHSALSDPHSHYTSGFPGFVALGGITHGRLGANNN